MEEEGAGCRLIPHGSTDFEEANHEHRHRGGVGLTGDANHGDMTPNLPHGTKPGNPHVSETFVVLFFSPLVSNPPLKMCLCYLFS